jgi:malate dehydrogenase (oxaloacetate-decarboxylating)(NADP+)
VKPTILLGLSGVGGVFTEEVLLEMAKYSDRPIIFPLSNPTDRAECSASMAFSCTGGRAIFASGSPFQPVSINGKTCYASQGNNMFIFPGVGLGAIVCGAKRISTSMFTKAAEILSSCVTMEQLEKGKVYPEISKIRSVSLKVAVEVVKVAFSQKLAKNQMPEEFHSLEEWISSYMYIPEYVPYIQNDQINKY